uniref:Cohesin subunit SA-1 n=1 Tax=Actinia equina TaxID=6106 RepID=A0A6C0WVZ5_ACTEQ|nr:cohesin subunit SA-1 [Actinia equina]
MFVHRYRDSRPEIRALCISEIGEWMKEYSTLFLNDKYLKYIVWNLHDKVGEVRLKSLQALLGLYGDEDLVPHLDVLTTRFKDRFVSMTLDKDNEVAVEAVKLMIHMYQYDKLDEEDCQQVQLLVFCTHKQVAHAAGQFLYKRIKDAAEEDIKPNKSKKGSKKSDKETKAVQLKKLLEFFINSEVHNHGAYLVDSLWNTASLIKDWKLMTDMLLDKADEAGLDDKEEEALIEIMVSSCKQSSQGQGPPGRVVRKLLSSKEKKTIISDKKELSAHFMQTVPDLLAKYGTDNEKVLSLVSMPQCFDLEEYGQRRLGKYLEELLNQLDSVVEKSTDPMVLQECAKTYRALTDSEYTLSTTAEVSRNKLVDQFVEAFKGSLQNGLNADDDDEDNNDRFVLISNLEKISAFYKAHDLGSWKLYDNLHHIMHHATTDQETVPDRILILTINAMQCLLLWTLTGLDANHPDKAQLKKLKKWSTTFIRQCEELVGYSNTEVRIEAFLCVCDLLIVFAKQLKNQSPLLGPLVYEPSDSFQATCRDFIVNHIFDNINEDEPEEEDDEQTDEKVEELSRKRTMLAAFLKLVIFNVFDMGLAAPVFSFLNKAFSDFGDIIKHAMNKCKEINKTTYVKTLLAALQQDFLNLKEEQEGEVDVKSEEFCIIKDLAHRFALSLGVDTTKSQAREALITLHREGIQYALSKSTGKKQSPKKGNIPPPNLPFFDILNEFTFRLIPQDKTGRSGVLPFLNKEAGDKVEMKGDEWNPLITYRNNLLGNQEGEEEHEPQKQDKSRSARGRPKKPPAPPPVQGKGKKRQASPEKEDEDSADDAVPLKRTKKMREDTEQSHVEPEREEKPEEDSGEESGLDEKNTKQQKRKRQDSEHSENPEEGEEDGDEDFDNSGVPSSSQKSWMASQTKASKRPRISYSKKDRDKVP